MSANHTKPISIVTTILICFFAFARPAFANPIALYQVRVKIYLTDHGDPYTAPAILTFECDNKWFEEYRTKTKVCMHYGCSVNITFEGGCDLTIATIDHKRHTFSSLIQDQDYNKFSGLPGTKPNFEARIDIGTNTVELLKPESDGTANAPNTRFWNNLTLALLVEVPVVFILTRLMSKKIQSRHLNTTRALIAGLTATLVTYPCLQLILQAISTFPSIDLLYICICLAEGLVVLVESKIYKWLLGIDGLDAILVSLVANGLSFLIGLFLI